MYTYWINFDKSSPSWSEFFPSEGAKGTKKRPAGVEFYREDVGELKINRTGPGRDSGQNNITVYDTLETWFTDDTKYSDEIEIEIYRGDRSGTLYFAGYFSISDTTINKEYRTFKFTPLIDDEYRDFVELKDTEFTMLPAMFADDNLVHTRSAVIEDPWIAAAGRAAGFNTFDATSGVITSFISTDAQDRGDSAQIDGGTALSSGDIVLIDVSAVSDGPYVDIEDTSGNSITVGGGQDITAVGIYVFEINAAQPAEVVVYSNSSTLNGSMTFAVRIGERAIDNVVSTFMDVLEEYITSASYMFLNGFIGNVKSTFINNDALPSDAPSSISSWMTTNPNGNYVSGVTASNELNDFCIGLTDKWLGNDPKGFDRSFNQFMSDLMETIQAGWYIDADGDFRIEHVKYFEKLWEDSTALDLTESTYDKYKSETDAKEIKFNKALLANREKFKWTQVGLPTDSEDFIGVDIIYDNLETIANVLKHGPSVTTDMTYLTENLSDASGEGYFFVIAPEVTGYREIEISTGVLSTDDVSNAAMSWANLQDKYWTWRRMSENGDMNDEDTTSFDSAVKFLEQAGVRFGYQSILDGFKKITTSQGTGQQLETVRDLDTDFITVLIGFNPY